MKKVLIAAIAGLIFSATASAQAPDTQVVSQACNSGNKLAYSIVAQRDKHTPLRDVLNVIAGTPVN